MNVKFLGASGMVTGSSYLVDGRILIDMGMFQGRAEVEVLNHQPLDFETSLLDGVIVTHAHLDHCGRLPLLVKNGFTGPIYMTEASKDLVNLVLLDAARIANNDREKVPLYSEEDVVSTMLLVRTVNYDEEFVLPYGVAAVLRDAGHILGSASVEIMSHGQRIVFSGDLGNSPQDLIRPTEYIEDGDFVVMESTYGDRLHKEENSEAVLTEEIVAVEKNGGTLLIPAFSLERTQELLHILDHLKKTGAVSAQIPVFLDSPMAIRATAIFKKYEELYNTELRNHSKTDDPFDFPGLVVVEKSGESRKIVQTGGAKVIIAGSGMMAGGRMVQHALDFLPYPTTKLLFVGYQAAGTLGRIILEGEKSRGNGNPLRVRIYGQEIEVKAAVREVTGMSAHADQKQLLHWLSKIQGVKKVILIHGEEGREVLAEKIKEEFSLEAIMPMVGETVEM